MALIKREQLGKNDLHSSKTSSNNVDNICILQQYIVLYIEKLKYL